jgi:putative ABC transport system substrate-binding protein
VAAKEATTRIPIVFSGGTPDSGLVKNMARPEGNLTGIHGTGSSLPAKAVQLLREVTPTMRSIAALLNLADPFHIVLHREVADAARAEQLEFLPIMLKGRDEIEPAFADLVRRGIGGVFVQPSLPIAYCAELSIKHRLPSVSLRREFAEAGGLMSYGASQPAVHRVLAGYVDKVLKGTPTSSLPVQVAAYFELVLNQKTAKALGITLSPMFLGKVDEVIE